MEKFSEKQSKHIKRGKASLISVEVILIIQRTYGLEAIWARNDCDNPNAGQCLPMFTDKRLRDKGFVMERARHHKAKWFAIGFSFASLAQSNAAMASDRANDPSFFVDLTFGMTTMKSKFVESNDTGTALNYSLGGFAGSSKQIEYNIGFEKDATSFALNDSKITYDWQDTKIRYHLGNFYAGLIFTRLTMEAERAGVEIIDAAGSGYGASLGFLSDIGKGGVFRVDVSSVGIAELKNNLPIESSVPSRLDIDVGASIDLFGKWSSFIFGYRMRTLSIKADVSAADTETSTYIGFRAMTLR